MTCIAVGKGREGLGAEDGCAGCRAELVVVCAEATCDDVIILDGEECCDKVVGVGNQVEEDGSGAHRGTCGMCPDCCKQGIGMGPCQRGSELWVGPGENGGLEEGGESSREERGEGRGD